MNDRLLREIDLINDHLLADWRWKSRYSGFKPDLRSLTERELDERYTRKRILARHFLNAVAARKARRLANVIPMFHRPQAG